MHREDTFFGVEQTLLCFAHLDTGEVALHVAFDGDVVVVACCDEVLALQVEQVQVVFVCLPHVHEVGAQALFQLLVGEFGVLDFQACVVEFAASVSVEEVEPESQSGVKAPVATFARGRRRVIFVVRVSVSGVQSQVGVITRAHFLVVQSCDVHVLSGLEQGSVCGQRGVPQFVELQVGVDVDERVADDEELVDVGHGHQFIEPDA